MISNSAISTTTGARIDSLEIDSNTIQYGGQGIVARGESGFGMGSNNKFRGNTINNSYLYGISLSYQSQTETSGNAITLRMGSSGSYGIYMSYSPTFGINYHFITGNKILNPGFSGIYVEASEHSGVQKALLQTIRSEDFRVPAVPVYT